MAKTTNPATGNKAEKPAAPAASGPSAAPGTADAAAKKPEKVAYPVPEGGLETVPEDFDPKKHKPLKVKDFKDETSWCLVQAAKFDAVAANWRKKAEEAKALGGIKERA
ncbi:MAG TPA: hypothetical protein VKA67_09875, partial [Verrucomicrobiae bacterium]|nr:hypothetical protein [Verrucomicrobiae bacterium]